MLNFKPRTYAVLLTLCLLFGFGSAFAAPVLAPVNTSAIVELDDYAADAFAPEAAIIPFESTYVANSNTGVFHYANCRYVYRMSENHKVFYDDRQDAINAGYRPCKVCQP